MPEPPAPLPVPAEGERMIFFEEHLRAQTIWSQQTFGPVAPTIPTSTTVRDEFDIPLDPAVAGFEILRLVKGVERFFPVAA